MIPEQLDKLYDVIVVGAGPAGLTAALYLARARYRVLVIEKDHIGGQITITAEVVNYPGIAHTSGATLTETMRQQAAHFGAEFLMAEVEDVIDEQSVKTVKTSRGERYAFGVLLATGAHPRRVGFQGEQEFQGHGVAYCATCDGEFFTGKEVFVIGGGFAAAEESVFLTKYASHVTVMMRGDGFSCAPAVAEAAMAHEKITVLPHMQVDEVSGDTALRYLRAHNNETGEVFAYRPKDGDTFGVFVFAGYEPEVVVDFVEQDAQGYIVTDTDQQTNVPGIYAAGDVCVKPLRQVVTAVGDGALAATALERYAAAMQRQTGLYPKAPVVQEEAPQTEQQESELFSAEMLAQLQTVFSRMEQPLHLVLQLDERPVSEELRQYMDALCALTDRLTMEVQDAAAKDAAPCVRICKADGSWIGLAFHGVPGGHEFTSFVLGLYNAAGPGQALDPELDLSVLQQPTHMKVLVSLSCTMCPELVTAAQRIAAELPDVTAEVYDINHFPQLKDQYHVMSVPCLVLNDTHVTFGKKNIRQLVDWMQSQQEL